MNQIEAIAFLRNHSLCVQATVNKAGAPEAALVSFAVSDDCELIFDTLVATRKIVNLRHNHAISLVVGWDLEQTMQIDGTADEPEGDDLVRVKQVYFRVHPEGAARDTASHTSYVRVRPSWIRYCDLRPASMRTVELDL